MNEASSKCVAEIDESISFNSNKKISTVLNFQKVGERLIAIAKHADFVGLDTSISQNIHFDHILTVKKHPTQDLYCIRGDCYVALKRQQEYYPQINEIFVLNCIYASISINKREYCYQLNILSPTKEVIYSLNLANGVNTVGRNNFDSSDSRLVCISREHILITVDEKVHFRSLSTTTGTFVNVNNFQFRMSDTPIIIKINESLNLQIKFEMPKDMDTLLGQCICPAQDGETISATKAVLKCEQVGCTSKSTIVISSYNKIDASKMYMTPQVPKKEVTLPEKTDSSNVIQVVSPFD
jgi:hypothetical protein